MPETKKGHGWTFTQVPNAVLLDSTLTASSKLVYAILCYHADQATRQAFPSLSTIAREAGLSRQTVITSIKSLIATGWIEAAKRQSQGGFEANIYTVHADVVVQKLDQGVVQKLDQGVVQKLDQGSQKIRHERYPYNDNHSSNENASSAAPRHSPIRTPPRANGQSPTPPTPPSRSAMKIVESNLPKGYGWRTPTAGQAINANKLRKAIGAQVFEQYVRWFFKTKPKRVWSEFNWSLLIKKAVYEQYLEEGARPTEMDRLRQTGDREKWGKVKADLQQQREKYSNKERSNATA